MTTWRGTRACRGCDGSGFDYRNPDTSTWESFHDCLCCGGTGRQAERMPVADALADAETLEDAVGVSPVPMTEGEWVLYREEHADVEQ